MEHDTVADPSPPHPTGVLHLRTWIPSELDEGFSTWCDVHHLDQLATPGVRRVRRYSLVTSTAVEPARFLTIYDLDRLEVLDGADYAEYRNRSTGLPDFLQGHLRAARSDAWLVAAAPAVDAMAPDGAGIAHLFLPDGPDIAAWFAEHAMALVETAGAASARLLHSRTGEQIVLLELEETATAGTADPSALPLPDEAPAGSGWGTYRLDFVARLGGATERDS